MLHYGISSLLRDETLRTHTVSDMLPPISVLLQGCGGEQHGETCT